jgi:hypothetical protein
MPVPANAASVVCRYATHGDLMNLTDASKKVVKAFQLPEGSTKHRMGLDGVIVERDGYATYRRMGVSEFTSRSQT